MSIVLGFTRLLGRLAGDSSSSDMIRRRNDVAYQREEQRLFLYSEQQRKKRGSKPLLASSSARQSFRISPMPDFVGSLDLGVKRKKVRRRSRN